MGSIDPFQDTVRARRAPVRTQHELPEHLRVVHANGLLLRGHPEDEVMETSQVGTGDQVLGDRGQRIEPITQSLQQTEREQVH